MAVKRGNSFSYRLLPFVVALLVLLAIVAGALFGRRSIERAHSAASWGGLFAFAVLCAVISYAVIEMAKRLLPIRELVQYRYILQWWRARARSVGASGDLSWAQLIAAMGLDPGFSLPRNGVNPTGEQIRTLRDQARNPIFGLPIQLLSAQVSNAVDLSLNEPAKYLELYYMATRSPSDALRLRSALYAVADQHAVADEPRQEWLSSYLAGAAPLESVYLHLIANTTGGLSPAIQAAAAEIAVPGLPEEAPGSSQLPTDNADADQPPEDSAADAAAFRVSQQSRSMLDSLQVAVGQRWRTSIYAASVLIAALAGLLIELAQPTQKRWLLVMVAALIGGPLAWTIRDITAVIERWRR